MNVQDLMASFIKAARVRFSARTSGSGIQLTGATTIDREGWLIGTSVMPTSAQSATIVAVVRDDDGHFHVLDLSMIKPVEWSNE